MVSEIQNTEKRNKAPLRDYRFSADTISLNNSQGGVLITYSFPQQKVVYKPESETRLRSTNPYNVCRLDETGGNTLKRETQTDLSTVPV